MGITHPQQPPPLRVNSRATIELPTLVVLAGFLLPSTPAIPRGRDYVVAAGRRLEDSPPL
jgi:hypothetical protein